MRGIRSVIKTKVDFPFPLPLSFSSAIPVPFSWFVLTFHRHFLFLRPSWFTTASRCISPCSFMHYCINLNPLLKLTFNGYKEK